MNSFNVDLGYFHTHSRVLEFIAYFSEWRHGKMLLGTCLCWFLVDIAYVPVLPLTNYLSSYSLP